MHAQPMEMSLLIVTTMRRQVGWGWSVCGPDQAQVPPQTLPSASVLSSFRKTACLTTKPRRELEVFAPGRWSRWDSLILPSVTKT